jgi:hypothetical protein
MHRTEEFNITYEGPGEGDDYFGNTAANFALHWPHRSRREIAVNVNDPALEYLATVLGIQVDAETADLIARRVGEILLRRYKDGDGHSEPYLTVSRATLAREPEVVNELRTLPWQPTTVAPAA